MSSEIEIERVPGLPHDLPPGEHVVWQGHPQWKAMARHTFKVRLFAVYFAVFIALRLVVAVKEHQGAAGVFQALLFVLAAGACLGILALMAWANARATIYTITTRRIVLRVGVALPMTWNLPFKRIASADLAVRKEGDGDIALQLTAPNRIGWLQLWPHVQPWHVIKARPTLRTIAEPAHVAALLGDAVRQWGAREAAPVLVATEGAPTVSVAASSPSAEIVRGRVVHELAAEAGH
jgi:Bacterial PH domain